MTFLGYANTSLYTGDIDYVDMPAKGSYWILPMACLCFLLDCLKFPMLILSR
jgi:hypothetical protein